MAVADCSGYTETLLQDTDEFKSYLADANDALAIAVQYMDSDGWKNKSGDWKLENTDKTTGDMVYSMQDKKLGKVYGAVAELHLPGFTLDEVFDEVYHHVDNTPQWNSDVIEYRPVLDVGKQTDLTYAAMVDVLGGLVSSRDILDVRGWRKTGDYIDMMSKSVKHKDHGDKKGRVRAHKYFENVRLSKSDKPDTFIWTWMNRIDLKGLLPKSVVDRVTHYLMLNYLKLLRTHLTDMKKA